MSAEDNREQKRKDDMRTRKDRMKETFRSAAFVTPEQVGVALGVVIDFVGTALEERPGDGPPKVSIALMKGGDWCCSINNWTSRVGLSCFAGTAERSVVGLAEKLVNGEPWRTLPQL